MSQIDNPTSTNHVQSTPIYNYMQQQQQKQKESQQQQSPTQPNSTNSNSVAYSDSPASRSHALENNNNSNNSHTIDNHTQIQNQTGYGSSPLGQQEQTIPQKLPLPLLPQKMPQPQPQPSTQTQTQTQTLSPPFDATSPPHDNVGKLSTTQKKFLLSTSSPEGMQVASKITPTRLANLLIRKGPLPIRHITAQLTLEVPSFELLSLSKQRRLIMAAMEQTDPANNVVFEKIGWGQWAVRKVGSDYIVTEGTEQREQQQQQQQQNQQQQSHLGGTPQSVSPEGQNGSNGKKLGKQPKPHSGEVEKKVININDLRNQTNLKLGWSKKKKDGGGGGGGGAPLEKNGARRESITNSAKNLHNIKLPNESIDNAIASDSEDEEDDRFNEIEEDEFDYDDDDDEDDDLSGLDERLIRNGRHRLHDQMDQDEPSNSSDQDAILDDEDEEMFAFDETAINRTSQQDKPKPKKLSPPLKFANRVPSKISPPPISSSASSYDSKAAARRRKSSSSAPSSVTKPSTLRHYHATHHTSHNHLLNNPIFINRSRLNSIENLDSYIASTSSGRNSTVSIGSPPPPIAFNYSSAGLGANGGSGSVIGSGEAIDVRSAVFGASPASVGNASPVGSWASNAGAARHYVINNEEAAKANKSRRKSSFNESHERSTLNSIRQQLKASPQPQTQSQHQRSSSISSDTDEEDWQSIGPEFLRQKKSNGEGVKKDEEVKANGVKVEDTKDVLANANADEEEKSAAFALVNLMSV
ncbi:STB3 [Candida metapsilosis]|uniref:STB3 n=1 Tax=Candida metapsilosis TaxID=273372 RepID=A0A8H7ZF17_9ASCO|nr:STB3 [Candida metapsilosis]